MIYSVLLLVFFVLCAGGWMAGYLLTPAERQPDAQVAILIPDGSSVRHIAKLLDDAHLINGDVRFLIIAKLTGLGSKLPAGEFLLSSAQKPLGVLRELVTAKPMLHTITIPEGWDRFQIGSLLEENGCCSREDFLQATETMTNLEKIGDEDAESLEGYLFPDTYMLTRKQFDADIIVNIMLDRFLQVWQDVTGDVDGEVDLHETVTLASMVEKETGTAGERPIIAGVFTNRLRLGMRLQSDPTVTYGIENFTGPITREQLNTPTPYNTYTVPGLPKGPICSPGKDALLAVVTPENHQYLYFVSQNDGTHHFSTSLSEHNQAVQKYQRKNSDKESK